MVRYDRKWFSFRSKTEGGGFPIEVLRRQDGAFSSYRKATWCIFPLNASKLPYGGTTPCGRFSCSDGKYPHAKPKVNSSLQPRITRKSKVADRVCAKWGKADGL